MQKDIYDWIKKWKEKKCVQEKIFCMRRKIYSTSTSLVSHTAPRAKAEASVSKIKGRLGLGCQRAGSNVAALLGNQKLIEPQETR